MEDIHTITARRLFDGTFKEEAELGDEDHCSGMAWKRSDECPHDGKFDPANQACRECEEDALEAMRNV